MTIFKKVRKHQRMAMFILAILTAAAFGVTGVMVSVISRQANAENIGHFILASPSGDRLVTVSAWEMEAVYQRWNRVFFEPATRPYSRGLSGVFIGIGRQVEFCLGMDTQKDPRQMRDRERDQFHRDLARDALILVRFAQASGIRVTDGELREFQMIRFLWEMSEKDPGSAELGKTQAERYAALVEREFHLSVPQFEETCREALEVIHLWMTFNAGAVVSERDVFDRYRNESEEARVRFVQLDPRNLFREVQVKSSAAAAARYRDQGFRYRIPDRLLCECASVSVESLIASTEPPSEKELKAFYEAHKAADYTLPPPAGDKPKEDGSGKPPEDPKVGEKPGDAPPPPKPSDPPAGAARPAEPAKPAEPAQAAGTPAPPAPQYKPFEEVQAEIREKLVRIKAGRNALDQVLKFKTAVDRKRRDEALLHSQNPRPIDFAAEAKAAGLAVSEVEVLSADDPRALTDVFGNLNSAAPGEEDNTPLTDYLQPIREGGDVLSGGFLGQKAAFLLRVKLVTPGGPPGYSLMLARRVELDVRRDLAREQASKRALDLLEAVRNRAEDACKKQGIDSQKDPEKALPLRMTAFDDVMAERKETVATTGYFTRTETPPEASPARPEMFREAFTPVGIKGAALPPGGVFRAERDVQLVVQLLDRRDGGGGNFEERRKDLLKRAHEEFAANLTTSWIRTVLDQAHWQAEKTQGHPPTGGVPDLPEDW